MKNTRRFLTLVLALLLALSVFTFAYAEEKIEIKWLGYYTSNIPVSEDTYAEKLLEERFGVEITPVTGVTSENMDTFIASGDILDVTCYASYLDNNFTYMYDQAMIREFPEEWLWEYYPTGMKIYSDYLGADFFEKGYHLVDGKCLVTPFTTTTKTSEYTVIYRKDWLENLGMTEPTTLDEFHDMLYAFTYNDPDGNGVDDTYGIDAIWAWTGVWPVYGAFGFINSSGSGHYDLHDDGTVTYTTVQEEYKQALAIIEQWYQEGIIDPECITDDRSAVRTKWANGSVGAMVDTQTWWYSNRGSSSIIALAEDVFGEGTVDVLGPLTTTYGDGVVHTGAGFPGVHANRALAFSDNATDEQIIAVLKILEGMASDHQLQMNINFGEEGVDYIMTEDGQLQVQPHVSVEYMASKGISDTFYGYGATDPYMATVTFSARDKANIEKAMSWPMDLYSGNNFPSVTNEAYNQYGEEVKKLEKEFYHNVLLGTVDLEAEWDNYVANMYKAGLDKIIPEYEALLAK